MNRLGLGLGNLGLALLVACQEPPRREVASPWPGPEKVEAVGPSDAYRGNLSGLAADPSGRRIVWAVRNSPGTLYRLRETAAGDWRRGAWREGARLRYPDGHGDPDAEGVTVAPRLGAARVYVVAERDNASPDSSRISVLEYLPPDSASGDLVAFREWDLTRLLPPTAPNGGAEAIVWIPDTDLVRGGLRDETRGAPYDPGTYGPHGGGVFAIALEDLAEFHLFVLEDSPARATRIGSFATGLDGVSAAHYDREQHALWAVCDDRCGNLTRVFWVDSDGGLGTRGRFTALRTFERPDSLPDVNHEGFVILPSDDCGDGLRDVLWADDDETAGVALRRGALPCTPIGRR